MYLRSCGSSPSALRSVERIVLGILYNPATGPETRQWLKEKVFGPDETFEYEP